MAYESVKQFSFQIGYRKCIMEIRPKVRYEDNNCEPYEGETNSISKVSFSIRCDLLNSD